MDATSPSINAAVPGSPDEASNRAAQIAIAKARGALRRYRFMALLTGGMLLVLCLEMVLKYVVRADGAVRLLAWVPFAHGWIYVVYLVTVATVWSTMRWSWGRLAVMVIAGVVPVMSFLVERRVYADGQEALVAVRQRYPEHG